MARIEIAYKMKHWKGVSEAAHSIKGAALAMGFDAMRCVAEKMENEAKSGCYDNLVSYYNELQSFQSELDELK